MKYLGAALILTACVAGGLVYAGEMRRRARTLAGLSAALELMAGELEARLSPLPELCAFLSERTDGETGRFFTVLTASLSRLGGAEFAQLWHEAAKGSLCSLTEREMDELTRLGALLGRYALDEQLSALRACEAYLREAAERAGESYPEQRRLGLCLTATAGILLIIALI